MREPERTLNFITQGESEELAFTGKWKNSLCLKIKQNWNGISHNKLYFKPHFSE